MRRKTYEDGIRESLDALQRLSAPEIMFPMGHLTELAEAQGRITALLNASRSARFETCCPEPNTYLCSDEVFTCHACGWQDETYPGPRSGGTDDRI